MTIRPFRDGDEAAVLLVWFKSGKAAYPYLPDWQTLTLEMAEDIFRKTILSRCRISVGTHDKEIVAFLAMKGSYIDRMYVTPEQQRTGWGSRFIAFAKRLFPDGLELHTHQQNHDARRFYEKHGFKAVKFGWSPPPENVPDVEYHWRPG